jgi:hypothetical protein
MSRATSSSTIMENPILKPDAAEVVKKYGEIALGGQVAPSPANQCWPQPLPFIYKNFGTQLLQQPHQVIISTTRTTKSVTYA